MKLGKCTASNFGSYSFLEFDFSNRGLALVHGATGSGKSTLADLACWTLFGCTAKDGSADDVRSWTNMSEPTQVDLMVDNLEVTRIRGTSKQNDLFWTETPDGPEIRGKDLTETQTLLEKRLGVSADLYLSAAYYSEFSPTASFFTAKAKERRAIFENLANLTFPIALGEKAALAKKDAKELHRKLEAQYAAAKGKADQLLDSHKKARKDALAFDQALEQSIANLRQKALSFEDDKNARIAVLQAKLEVETREHAQRQDALITRLEALAESILDEGQLTHEINQAERLVKKHQKEHCPSCSQPVPSLGLEAALEALEAAKEAKRENAVRQMRLDAGAASLDTSTSWVSPLVAQTERIQSEVNEFDARAQSESERSNPFMEQIRRLKKEFEEADIDAGVISWNAEKAKLKALSYGQIQDLSLSLRGALLQKAVKDIETATNLCMETYFDAELRVTFELEGSDSLKVGIFKSGYEASYKQLSKGQRQLLKLSYSVAVMKASSNIAGTHFSTLFFDEALDGLDAELKVKAFTLFESMSQDHETVMLIDHSPDFHQLFTTKFHVTLDGDESSIEEEHE